MLAQILNRAQQYKQGPLSNWDALLKHIWLFLSYLTQMSNDLLNLEMSVTCSHSAEALQIFVCMRI